MRRGPTAWIVTTCVLVPLWTPVLVRTYAWIIILQRQGIINDALISTGLIGRPLTLLYTTGAVILAMTQVLLPFMILPIQSSLRSIPKDLPQAALGLGASRFRVFANVTWPQLRNTNIFVLVISVIGAFQVFDPSFVMTPDGGPLFSTDTLVTYIYHTGITNLNLSYAASIGIFLFVVVFILTLIQMRLTRAWEQ